MQRYYEIYKIQEFYLVYAKQECAAKSGGSVVEHHPSYWEQPFNQPYFDNTTKRDTTTTVGQTAFLPCRVRNLGDRARKRNDRTKVYSEIKRKLFYTMSNEPAVSGNTV
ncbi:hypothetical protein WN51_06506 [Melipona quadrifasciata]|uniref:Ig-like domain-containing protein n=1 Tax=Melipona quadrifasciata TaxID=166423 RepID=A0A0M8ZT52_9HYME|nr:hypothetical protein WN51_06506 [Melipona quadrifasciata]